MMTGNRISKSLSFPPPAFSSARLRLSGQAALSGGVDARLVMPAAEHALCLAWHGDHVFAGTASGEIVMLPRGRSAAAPLHLAAPPAPVDGGWGDSEEPGWGFGGPDGFGEGRGAGNDAGGGGGGGGESGGQSGGDGGGEGMHVVKSLAIIDGCVTL